MRERQLTDMAIRDRRWSETTSEILRGNGELQTQTEGHGLQLADSVALGELAVGNLREFVNWANELDRAAVELSGGDIAKLHGADYAEALARRVAHHSGRSALNMVRSADRRVAHRARYTNRARALRAENVRLFKLEAGDPGL